VNETTLRDGTAYMLYHYNIYWADTTCDPCESGR